MSIDIDLALFVLAEAVFGILAGGYAALQLLAYGHSEGGEEAGGPGFAVRLLQNPVANYFALGIGRMAAVVLVIVTAVRLAGDWFGDRESLSTALAVVAVAVPLVAGNIAAVRGPAEFFRRTRFVIYTVVYALYPVASLVIAVLKRTPGGLLDALAFPVLPFKRRLEIVGQSNGDDAADEQDLVSSVFEFQETKVREVMIPRIDMVAVNIHMDPAEAVNEIIEAGHSRVPVFDESVDRVVGIVHTKDLLKAIHDGEAPDLAALKREAYFVPESKMIDDLLSEFRARRIHIAIVVDEYGGTAGLITLEDVLEELVGDIQDEFDAEEELIKRVDDDSALCSSKIRIDELQEALGVVLENSTADTLGGYLYENFGRVPPVGAVFRQGPLQFKVQSVLRQRIDKVLITGLSSGRSSVQDGVS